MSEPRKPKYIDDFDEASAAALVAMLSDPTVPGNVRLQIVNEILEASKADSFFETMWEEDMSLAPCPECGHENHWLIPEEDLNVMGHITHEKDSRVPRHTTEEVCPTFAEACSKKKTTA